MPPTPRKSAVKGNSTVPQSNQKFYCCRCGLAYSRQKGFFPTSHSPLYRGSGYLPWCSECVDDMYEQYRISLKDDKAAMRRMCMKLDLYWSESIYEMVERTAGLNSRVRNYITKSNLGRFINKTFDDTIKEEELLQRTTGFSPLSVAPPIEDMVKIVDSEDENIVIDDDVRLFWGPGYTPKMYQDLEDRRKYWMSKYPEGYQPSIGEEALIRQICNLEIDINRDRAAGKPADKNINTLNALMGSLNLKPTQKKDEADAELEKMPLGVGIQKWEYYRPLPETPKEHVDVRNIIKNITTWYLGHACKMVGLKNSYCKMYEDAMDELRVKRPEYDDEDDNTMLNDIFGSDGNESDQ